MSTATIWKQSTILKPGQNKKCQKFCQLHRFLNSFLQQAAEKKYSKNGAAEIFFGPSYFVTALPFISLIVVCTFRAKMTFANKWFIAIVRKGFAIELTKSI